MRKKDLVGQRFGRLTVISELSERQNGHILWSCRCDCGKQIKVNSCNLISGKSKSCGCVNKEKLLKRLTTHGCTHTKLHQVWEQIKARCYCSTNKSYKNYGYRGISMCNEWKCDFSLFRDWALSSGYKKGLTIDRINNDGNYEPTNCRWVNRNVQNNNKRNNIRVTEGGETKNLKQWCSLLGLNYSTIKARVQRGANPREALGFV